MNAYNLSILFVINFCLFSSFFSASSICCIVWLILSINSDPMVIGPCISFIDILNSCSISLRDNNLFSFHSTKLLLSLCYLSQTTYNKLSELITNHWCFYDGTLSSSSVIIKNLHHLHNVQLGLHNEISFSFYRYIRSCFGNNNNFLNHKQSHSSILQFYVHTI